MALNGNDSSKDHPRGQSWQERWFSHFVSLAIVGMGVFLVNKVMSTEAAVNELKTAVTVIESRLLDIRENSRDRFTGAGPLCLGFEHQICDAKETFLTAATGNHGCPKTKAIKIDLTEYKFHFACVDIIRFQLRIGVLVKRSTMRAGVGRIFDHGDRRVCIA